VIKSLEEGIYYNEMLSPIEAINDEFGHVKSLIFEKQIVEDGRWKDSGSVTEVPARCVMVAAGTSPNVIYEKEHPGTFKLDKYGQFFQSFAVIPSESEGPGRLGGAQQTIELIEIESPNETGFFTSYKHPRDNKKL